MWRQDGGNAVYRSVLDSGLRRTGTIRFRSVAGECARDTESARAKERRAGKSMVAEIAHVWTIEEVVSADSGNTSHSKLLAGTG